MRRDDGPQCAPASTTVASGAAYRGDIPGSSRSVGHDLVNHVAGGSGAQADKHGRSLSLFADAHQMGEPADEPGGVGPQPDVGHPLGGRIGMLDPLPRTELVAELLQD